MNSKFTAVIRRDGGWWIGWVAEVSGVNSQGDTREELLDNLRDALKEALETDGKDDEPSTDEENGPVGPLSIRWEEALADE